MRNALKPIDLLSILFIALLSAVTLVFAPRIPHWEWQLSRYGLLLIAIMSMSLYARRSKTWKPAIYLYAFLPVFAILVIFDSLGDLIIWIWDRTLDDALIKIDYAMFGVHPTVWMERFIHPALTTAMQFAYITYYPMAIVLGAVLLARGKRVEFDEALFGIVLCFYLSYVGYILVPAIGPRFTLTDVQTMSLQADSLTIAIQETLNRLEHNKTDAFPSGHTAVALMTLYYAWKFREKILTAALIPAVFALIISTVYLRYHYVIDVIAGILLTALTIWLAPKAYNFLSRVLNPSHQ